MPPEIKKEELSPDEFVYQELHRPPYLTIAAKTAADIEAAEARKLAIAEERLKEVAVPEITSSLSTS